MKNKIYQKISLIMVICLIFLPWQVTAESTLDLEQQLIERQRQIAELERKQAEYEASIAKKRSEVRTLANQISIIDDQLQRTSLGIETIQTKIQATEIEISNVQKSIESEQARIDEGRKQLASTVRALAKTKSVPLFKILLTHDSFSDFFDEMQAYNRVQIAATDLVNEVELSKQALLKKQEDLNNSRIQLTAQTETLAEKQYQLSDEQALQEAILNKTKLDEQQYAALLQAVKQEQLEADAEIKRLEREVRERLLAEGKISDVVATLQWPVPKNRVTTYFKDPDYPFNHLFMHEAIDIRAAQGTTIKAPADGYVAKVRTGDPRRYWYVVLVHDGGISTVFGHVSRVYIDDGERVTAGQTIALSGAYPGSPGAGPFTTGPHLHFEVHKNGSPVNPLDYLP